MKPWGEERQCECCRGQQSIHPIYATAESARKRICIQLCAPLQIKVKGDWGLFQAICFMCEMSLQIHLHMKSQKSHFHTDLYSKNNYFESNHAPLHGKLGNMFPSGSGTSCLLLLVLLEQRRSGRKMMSALTVMIQTVKQWQRLQVMFAAEADNQHVMMDYHIFPTR